MCTRVFLLLYILQHAHHQKFGFLPNTVVAVDPFGPPPPPTLQLEATNLFPVSMHLYFLSSLVCSFVFVY